MTPEERQAEITRNTAIQGITQAIIHDPTMGEAVREKARDTAVAVHTVLTRLKGGQ